jgi:3'-5' exoribonuclease
MLSTVRDLKAPGTEANGRPFASLLVVKKLAAKTASNGNPFFSADLGDRTGSFGCTVFGDSPAFEVLKAAGEGGVVRIEGKIDFYQGRLSPACSALRSSTEIELSAPGNAREPGRGTPRRITTSYGGNSRGSSSAITHELRLTVRGVFDEIGENFRWSPAAVAMHHAYRHGLLEHTVHMARACRALLPLYPKWTPISPWPASSCTTPARSSNTRARLPPVAAGEASCRATSCSATNSPATRASRCWTPERLERLEHIILSHQGEPEWGAAVYAATPEAVFVSMIDNLDAKMGMVQRALRQASEGGRVFRATARSEFAAADEKNLARGTRRHLTIAEPALRRGCWRLLMLDHRQEHRDDDDADPRP